MAAVSEIASRPRRTWPQRLVLAVGMLLTLGCVVGAAGVGYGGWKYSEIDRYHDVSLPDVAKGEPANFLVVGSDTRGTLDEGEPNSDAFTGAGDGSRSDTILVVRVDPSKESATMLSLPRDLWVPIAGKGMEQRINVAYALGRQVLVDTIQQYLGIPINHYVEVSFNGFQDLVGAIGGVPMYFDRAMKDGNSGLDVLHPGCITLDGPQALAFARARHLQYMRDGVYRSDPTGDLGRITRQQLLVRKAISKAASKGLSNPLTLKRLVDVGVANVGIDEALSVGDLVSLGRAFKDFSGDELHTLTVPVTPFTTDGGAEVVALDENAAVPILDQFRALKDTAPGSGLATKVTERDVSVRVLNGSGVPMRATNVAGALDRAGFAVAGIGNAEDIGGADVARTEIRYAAGDEAAAQLLGRHLRAGAELVADPDVEAGTVVLVAGRDFSTVTAEALDAVPGATPGDATTGSTTTTATTRPTTTTTEPIGRTPGEPPPGVSCG